jgi:alkylation response protein AidB-like acyl-CoA dehydrogenase
MKGFRAGKKENKLGCRASDTSEIVMEDCRIPAENIVGKEGRGSSTR